MRVLPADVYDTLELSAWEFGGLGAGSCYDVIGNPLCVIGHAIWCEGGQSGEVAMQKAIHAALSGPTSLNDFGVGAINEESGNPRNARVPFSRWCAKLGVVRGE